MAVERGARPRGRVGRSPAGRSPSSLKRPDIGPPPLLVARARPGERLEPGERLAAAVDQPGGLVAVLEEGLEGVFGEAARCGGAVVADALFIVSR